MNIERLSRIKVPLLSKDIQNAFMGKINKVNSRLKDLEDTRKALVLEKLDIYESLRRSY